MIWDLKDDQSSEGSEEVGKLGELVGSLAGKDIAHSQKACEEDLLRKIRWFIQRTERNQVTEHQLRLRVQGCHSADEQQTNHTEICRSQKGFQSFFLRTMRNHWKLLSKNEMIRLVFWKGYSGCKIVAEDKNTLEARYS